MSSDYFDDSMSASEVFSRLNHRSGYIEGTVFTPLGIVDCVSEDGYSRADFIHDGRLYIRTWRREFTTRGLAAKAHQFAREVTEQDDAA